MKHRQVNAICANTVLLTKSDSFANCFAGLFKCVFQDTPCILDMFLFLDKFLRRHFRTRSKRQEARGCAQACLLFCGIKPVLWLQGCRISSWCRLRLKIKPKTSVRLQIRARGNGAHGPAWMSCLPGQRSGDRGKIKRRGRGQITLKRDIIPASI